LLLRFRRWSFLYVVRKERQTESPAEKEREKSIVKPAIPVPAMNSIRMRRRKVRVIKP
jgi:hypothetical protein